MLCIDAQAGVPAALRTIVLRLRYRPVWTLNDSTATPAVDEFDGEMIFGSNAQNSAGQGAHSGRKQTDQSEADKMAKSA
jgi:hypothetical protein